MAGRVIRTFAAAIVNADGTFVSQNGAFLDCKKLDTGEYALTLIDQVDPTEAILHVTIRGIDPSPLQVAAAMFSDNLAIVAIDHDQAGKHDAPFYLTIDRF